MTLNTLLSLFAALFSAFLAFFVLLKDRHSFVHRTLAVGMMALASEAIFTGLSFHTLLPAKVELWQRMRLFATAVLPGLWLLFSFSFARENYKEFLAKWKWFILSLSLLSLSIVVLFAHSFFLGEPLFSATSGWVFRLGWPGYAFHLIFLISAAVLVGNLERTLRHSTGRMRWQIKFVGLGLGGLFGARIYVVSQSVLFHTLRLDLELVNMGALIVASALIFKSLLRARLLNVNLYVSHSFLFNSFTVLLVGIYLIAVGVLAKVASYFHEEQVMGFWAFLVFLALLGLAVLLLSDRVRKQMKRSISRHFKRPLYDYQTEWRKFTEHTTSVTDVKDLCSIIVKMVANTLDVLSVTIWLLDEAEKRVSLGGSTVFSLGQRQELATVEHDIIELINTMRREELPFDFDYATGDWPTNEKEPRPDFCDRMRVRYCFPLTVRGKFLGVMTLAHRVGDEAFSAEELALLKTIAGQTSGNLLNLKLSADLRQAKEMEAFQTMSTFFVHDLKNLASTLSLTMQNLPIHFGNPDFQEDALRTISQSVSKINTLCNRLSLLRQKIEIHPIETDLNRLVTATLSSMNGYFKTPIVRDLHPIPPLLIDMEQIEKLLVNLLTNANEAIGHAGTITITTSCRDSWVELSVCDNGCGLSQRFIQESLFRPFQTTKKQGMGIGLFHSKMIVEAHQGRLEVESKEGKGTTFRIMFPIKVKNKEEWNSGIMEGWNDGMME